MTDVCTSVGVPDGEDIITIPYDALNENTPERGRFNACSDLIFGRAGSVYVAGVRYDYSDCDRITGPAFDELHRDDAYDRSELFLDEVGGVVCWGEDCRDSGNF